LSKIDIIQELKAKYPKLTIPLIKNIVEMLFENISKSLVHNKSVEIKAFGRFNIKNLKEKHNAINPKTQEKIYVPSKKVVRYKMSKVFFNSINLKKNIGK